MQWGFLTLPNGKEVVELTECKWVDNVLTAYPANELATVLAAKSLDGLMRSLDQVDELEGITDADALLEAKGRILAGTFGGKEQAAELQAILGKVHGVVGDLLTVPEPQDTGSPEDKPVDRVDLHFVNRKVAEVETFLLELSLDE